MATGRPRGGLDTESVATLITIRSRDSCVEHYITMVATVDESPNAILVLRFSSTWRHKLKPSNCTTDPVDI